MKKYFKFNQKFNSSKYWEKRYKSGGNSGDGSNGILAKFKISIINEFINKNNIVSVIELGCGDSNILANCNYRNYYGFDVSKTIIALNKEKYRHDPLKNFFHIKKIKNFTAELSLSIDVIYHLIEDNIFEKHLKSLFNSSNKFVIIYSSNFDKFYSKKSHVLHRKFDSYIEENFKSFKLSEVINNPFPELSTANFYIYEKIE